jgi:hypothetical protein
MNKGCSRFGSVCPKKPTELRYIDFRKYKSDQIKNQFKPNQFGLVNADFFGIKSGNLIPTFLNNSSRNIRA